MMILKVVCNLKFWGRLVMFTCMLSSCQTVNSITLSQIPKKSNRTNIVKSHGSRVYLLIIPVSSTEAFDSARQDLINQCPKGRIEGLLSKLETANYFLFFSLERLTLQGYCVSKSSISLNSSGDFHHAST